MMLRQEYILYLRLQALMHVRLVLSACKLCFALALGVPCIASLIFETQLQYVQARAKLIRTKI